MEERGNCIACSRQNLPTILCSVEINSVVKTLRIHPFCSLFFANLTFTSENTNPLHCYIVYENPSLLMRKCLMCQNQNGKLPVHCHQELHQPLLKTLYAFLSR